MDDGVEVVRELGADLGQRDRVDGVADDGVDLELLCRDLEIIPACAADDDLVAGVAEAFRDDATQFGVTAGDQHIHHQ